MEPQHQARQYRILDKRSFASTLFRLRLPQRSTGPAGARSSEGKRAAIRETAAHAITGNSGGSRAARLTEGLCR